MSDEKLAPVLRSWLKATDVTPSGATRSAANVMARLPQCRQRGRWWPLPSFGRASVAPPADFRTGFPPTTIARAYGHAPAITGRTHAMFSPVKAIITGALIFAVGSAYLIVQPLDQQGGSVPGAPTDIVGESTAVTATADCTLTTSGTWQLASAPYSLTNHVLTCTETASDPRVTGTSTVLLNVESWSEGLKHEDPANSVSWNEYTLEGPDGTWSGHGYGFYDSTQTAHGLTIATGSGAYEGLTYTQSLTVPNGTANAVSIGLIQAGSAPPGFPAMPFPEPSPSPPSE